MITRNKNFESKFEAFPYQIDAVDYVKDKDYGAIFHEQGLGKSKIAIDVILYWLKNQILDYIVLVAKKGLVENWKKELNNHTFLKPRIIGNNPVANRMAFISSSNVILTHYEAVKMEENRLIDFAQSNRVGLILDEATKIKNPDSSLTKIFHGIAPYFKKRLILTGTPVANRPYDIWSQIYFLDQGKSLGKNFDDFKKNHDLSNKFGKEVNTNFSMYNKDSSVQKFEQNLDKLKNKIQSFSIRENKSSEHIDLPVKNIKNIICDWEPSQKILYDKYVIDLGADIQKDGIDTHDESDEIIKRLLRLIQIASNPQLVDEKYRNTPGKINKLDSLLGEIFSKKEKVIVWSNFTSNINYFYSKYYDEGAVRIHGKLNMDQRNNSVELFLKDPEIKLLFATPGSAKEGLTLTVANHAIFYDRGFSLDDYLQAQDRIHRVSQTKECFIYNLIMDNSIDLWLDELIRTKHYAAKLAQGDIGIEEYQENVDYSFSDLLKGVLNGN